METESRDLPTCESFIYTLDVVPNTCNPSEQLRQGTQQVAHTVVIANKHPTIHDTVKKEKGGIVEKINDANAHQHNTTTQQDNIPSDAEDNPTNFSGPKTVELSKDNRVIQKPSQDEVVVQIADLL